MSKGALGRALKTTNGGWPNFKTFGAQLNRTPTDYRAELFEMGQNERLREIANTSNLLGQDANPSGSAKLGQKVDYGCYTPSISSRAADELSGICDLAHGAERAAVGGR